MDPAIRPALQRIIDQTAQAAPTETMVQNPPMPNPVDVKRGEYLQRGTLPLILLAAPLAALAANAPLVAIIAATALLWLLLTLAYNTEPQLEREGKRGGERKNSDSWIRVATFPWHLVKALLLAIPRILLLVIIYMAGTAVATAALALPVHTISWYFIADWGIPVPLLNDVPFSASGLALGGFMAIGWLVTVFAPQSMMIRLGGGVRARAQTQSPGGRAIHRSGWGSTCSSGAGAQGRRARQPCCSPYGPSSPWPCARCRFWACRSTGCRSPRAGRNLTHQPSAHMAVVYPIRSFRHTFTGNSPQISSGRSPPQARSL